MPMMVNIEYHLFQQKNFQNQLKLKTHLLTSLNGEILAKAINSTIFATGNDDLRPVMSGVFFQFR